MLKYLEKKLSCDTLSGRKFCRLQNLARKELKVCVNIPWLLLLQVCVVIDLRALPAR